LIAVFSQDRRIKYKKGARSFIINQGLTLTSVIELHDEKKMPKAKQIFKHTQLSFFRVLITKSSIGNNYYSD